MALSGALAPSYTFDSALTSVFRAVLETKPIEQSWRKHPLLGMLEKESSDPYTITGGYNLHIPFAVTGSSRAQNIRGATTITMTDSDDVSMLQYTMAHTTQPIVIWGTDEDETRSDERLYSLADRKTKAAQNELSDKVSADIWASSTPTLGVSGIRLAFPTDGGNSSTTYGGIAGNTVTSWRSEAITTGGVATTAMLGQMDQMDQNIRENQSRDWDVIFSTFNLERIYKQVARQYLSVTSSGAAKKAADLGYSSAAYNQKPVIPDQECPSGHLYFVSLESTKLVKQTDRWFKMGGFKEPTQQYGRMALLHARYAFVVNERRCNGDISGLTES